MAEYDSSSGRKEYNLRVPEASPEQQENFVYISHPCNKHSR